MKKGVSAVLKFSIWMFLVFGIFVLGFIFRYEILNFLGITYIGENSQIKIDSVLISSDNQTAYALVESNDPKLNFSHFEIIFEGSGKKYSYVIENYSINSEEQEFNITAEEVKLQNPEFKDFSKIESMMIVFKPKFETRTFSSYVYQYDYEKVSREKNEDLENESIMENSFEEDGTLFVNTDKKIRKEKPSRGNSGGGKDKSPPEENDTGEIPQNLSKGYLAYFSFDETSGNIIYDSENKFNGTLNNVSRIKGVSGNALEFNGSGYIDLGVNEEFNSISDEITLSVWVKPSLVGNYQGLIMHGGENIDTYALYVYPSDGSLGFKTTGTVNPWISVSVPEIYDGKWHNLVVSYNNFSKNVYVDGKKIYEIEAGGKIELGTGKRLLIGAGRDLEEPTLRYDGLMDEVRIYNFSLNDSEIINLYSSINFSEENNSIEEPPIIDEIEPFVCPEGNICYYISSSTGDDSNNGTSELYPWKSLEKVNSVNFNPGNYVMFKRGDSWTGTLTIKNSGVAGSPITFGAYGTSSEKPIITGFTKVTDWVNKGSNIWESANPVSTLDTLNMVVIEGANTPKGRFPNIEEDNGGYLVIESHVDDKSITNAHLSGNIDWTGGELIVRENRWIIDKTRILSHESSTIGFDKKFQYGLTNGFGFFIQDHPKTLNKQNEWYYNSTSKKIQIYSSSKPSNVQVSTVDRLIDLKGNYITIQSLNIAGANIYGIFDSTASRNILVENCEISFTVEGIAVSARDSKYENNIIKESNNIGIGIRYNSPNTIIKNNLIMNTGLHPGMEVQKGIYDTRNSGIYDAGGSPNLLIEYNTIINSGYSGIIFYSNDTVVKNNYVDTYCSVIDDCGGIYTWKRYNVLVSDNIVINGIGAPQGTTSTSKAAVGIYIDDYSVGVQVLNNVVANNPQAGIFLHNTKDTVVADNLAYNNDIQFLISNNGASLESENIDVQNNLFVSKEISQRVARLSTIYNNILSLGDFNNNVYARPFNEGATIQTNEPSIGVSYRTLENWQVYSGQDLNSKTSPIEKKSYELTYLGENKFLNSNFDGDVSYVGKYNSAGNMVLSWVNNVLDGGSLKVDFNTVATGLSYVYFRIGDISAGKNYLFKYDIISSSDSGSLNVFLVRTSPSWGRASAVLKDGLSTKRTTEEFLLTSTLDVSSASASFEYDQTLGPIWVDNVEVYEVEVDYINLEDYFVFEYNPSKETKIINLEEDYLDMRGKVYSGIVSIPPYKGIVLIKE